MSNETVTQMQNQIDSTIGAPARTYASMVLDHFEQLSNLQFEAAKAYAETSIQQTHAALDVKDPSDIRAFVENQQNVAKDLGERMKGDAEKVVSLNQAFAQNAQKVGQESAEKVSKAAQDSAKSATQAASQSK